MTVLIPLGVLALLSLLARDPIAAGTFLVIFCLVALYL
jgi:hypothetical protein